MICCFRAEAGKLSEELPPRRRNIRPRWAQHSAPVAPEAGRWHQGRGVHWDSWIAGRKPTRGNLGLDHGLP